MTSTPSGAGCPASSSSAAAAPWGSRSNTASMVALSAPVRMRSGWARAPMTRRMASTTMDFPAPVSPVTALRPGPRDTVTASMTARFLRRSSLSMLGGPRRFAGILRPTRTMPPVVSGWRPPGPGLPLAPLELGPQHREEMLLRNAEEANAGRGLADLDAIAALEMEPHLAVHREHHVLVRLQRHVDGLAARQHDGSVGERVRADGREHDGVHGGEHDGPAGRETVGGRPGRGRDDEPVGAVGGGELPLHRDVE